MRWLYSTDYSIKTAEGYYVSRTGPEGDYKYTAWAPCAPGESWYKRNYKPLGVFGSAEAAKGVCEEHNMEQAA